MEDYHPFTDPKFNREVQDVLRDKLQEIVDLIGPRECAHGDWEECVTCHWEDTWSPGPQIINHFVLVASFESMNGGEPTVSVMVPTRQYDYITSGLLHEALDER